MISSNPNDGITYLANTNYRSEQRRFGIKRADRRSHLYLVGATGTGKSTLIETMIRQDVASGEGLALLDPHGDLAEKLHDVCIEQHRNDVIYLDISNPENPYGFNPVADVPVERRALVASGILEVFQKVWIDSWGPRLEHLLRYAVAALLDQPGGTTLADILRLLDDGDYRREVARHTRSTRVRRFWLKEYEDYPTRLRAEAIMPAQNKVGAFLTNPLIDRLLAGADQPLDLRRIMDEGQILLVNLARGKLGGDTTALVGALLTTSLGVTAFSRADTPEERRRDFWIYLDEFQNVTTLSLATMLSELRKYRAGFTLANQYTSAIDAHVRDAVLGNVGTIVAFRLGPSDAEELAPYFAPTISAADLVALPNHRAYLRLMVDGTPTTPFSADMTLPE